MISVWEGGREGGKEEERETEQETETERCNVSISDPGLPPPQDHEKIRLTTQAWSLTQLPTLLKESDPGLGPPAPPDGGGRPDHRGRRQGCEPAH